MRNLSKMLAIALMALAAAPLAPNLAHAQALDIDAPDIEKGEREVRLVNIMNQGWRRGSAGEPRSSHELSTAYAPTDWFKGVVHLDVENLIGEDVIADHVGLESFIALRKAGDEGDLALAWYTAVMLSTDELSTNSFLFGPVIAIRQGKAALTLNTYFEDQFGRNAARGLNLLCGAQARYELSERIAIGLEAFGTIDDLGDPPSWREQDHRIGPAVFLSWDVGEKRKLGLDLGVYVGLTDAAPDLTFKVNSGLTF